MRFADRHREHIFPHAADGTQQEGQYFGSHPRNPLVPRARGCGASGPASGLSVLTRPRRQVWGASEPGASPAGSSFGSICRRAHPTAVEAQARALSRSRPIGVGDPYRSAAANGVKSSIPSSVEGSSISIPCTYLVVVACGIEKLASEIDLSCHYAASSLPSESAAGSWCRTFAPITHALLADDNDAAGTSMPFKVLPTDRLTRPILDLRLDHEKVEIAVLTASPRAWEPNRITPVGQAQPPTNAGQPPLSPPRRTREHGNGRDRRWPASAVRRGPRRRLGSRGAVGEAGVPEGGSG